jgi:putative heme-binding domain-containing protein
MNNIRLIAVALSTGLAISCQTEKTDLRIKAFDPAQASEMASAIEPTVTPELAQGLSLKLWGSDSLIADPVSIDVDDYGNLFYTRTNRQRNSEFDIRGHQDWEIASIRLQTIEEKREFLRRTLSPQNSSKNTWLEDVNNDGSHDWKDMTIEKEHVYKVTDVSGDGIADQSQLVVDDFHEEVTDAAGGVMKHGDDLFFNVGPDMWRIKDKNADGVADETTSISHGYGIHIGFSGHGMSGIEVGPEGKIYWQIGDIGFNGTSPDGKKWEYPNSGVVVRSNADGTDFEVFAHGNRNTHEFVFDEYGNMISQDNDGDHPGESERLVYIVNGADIGWRANWQYGKYRDPDNNTYKVWMDEKMYTPRWEGQPAYITPTIRNFVNGPTGMLYNPGTALSAKWKNTFFIVEFVGNPSRSGIHAFKLNPKGASFELGEYQKILGGVLATGIDFGPDGAMYVADWIDGWGTKSRGRVWKLDATDADMQAREAVKTILGSDFSEMEMEKLNDLLRHADMRVRQKAQFEIVERGNDGLDVLRATLEQKDHQLARVHAIWGISQFARKKIEHAKLLVPSLNDSDPEIKAQAARWIGDVRYSDDADALIPLLKDEYPRARFFAAEALGRIAHEPAISPIIEMLNSNNDEDVYLRHAGSLALARIKKPEPVVALTSHPSRAVRIAAVVALRRMAHPGVGQFLDDKDEFIVTEAARAINDDLSIPEALPALGSALLNYNFTNEAFVRRAISANLRVGTPETMQNLVAYINHEGSPLPMRAEALAALSTWSKPSVLDRVDGRFRGEITRDPAELRAVAGDVITGLLTHKDVTLRLGAVRALGKIGYAEAHEQIFTRLKSDPDATVRVGAVRVLATTDYVKTNDAIKQALADKDKTVRIAGLDLLTKTDMPKTEMVTLLNQVIDTRTTEEKQAALLTLGTLPLENTQASFDRLLKKLEQKQLAPEVQLELAEAIDSTKSTVLIDNFKSLTSKGNADTLMAPFAGALFGGDVEQGRRIFYRNQTAQCIRCHAYDDYGGSAGPRLNGVAARLTRQELLESLVNPDSRIAPGFGTVRLDLNNGKTVRGILQNETKNAFKLKIGDRPDTVVMRSDVKNRVDGASSMPPMRMLLSKREIRDVVAFLATLKEDN